MKQEIMNIKLTREDLVLINTALLDAIDLNEKELPKYKNDKLMIKGINELIKEYELMRKRIYNTRGF
jgi:hypothetical protein